MSLINLCKCTRIIYTAVNNKGYIKFDKPL